MKVFWVSNKSVPFVVCILSSSFVVIWSAVRRSMCELNLVYALVEAAVSLRVSKIILQCELAYNNLCTFVNKGRGLWDRKLAHFGCLNYSVHAVERISLLSIKRLLKWAFKVYLENSRSKNALNSKITFQEMFKINFGFIRWSSSFNCPLLLLLLLLLLQEFHQKLQLCSSLHHFPSGINDVKLLLAVTNCVADCVCLKGLAFCRALLAPMHLKQ